MVRPQGLPGWFVGTAVALCVLPLALNVAGVDLGTNVDPLDLDVAVLAPAKQARELIFEQSRGSYTHTILEWTATVVAMLTALLAFTHFTMKRDVVAPIVGVALFAAGSVDAFHTLAADRLIDATADNANLIPFTWAVSRMFNAVIPLTALLLYFFARRNKLGSAARESLLFVLGSAAVLSASAYTIIRYCATQAVLPRTMFPESVVTRPWDLAPLLIYAVSGLVIYPLFERHVRSNFVAALRISVIADFATQMHMAFGSTALFDNHFNAAHFLKVVAYAIPCAGLLLDYVAMHRSSEWADKHVKAKADYVRAIVECSRDAIVSTNTAGVVREWNGAAAKLFGYSAAEIVGQHQSILCPNELRSQAAEQLRSLAAGEIVATVETIRTDKDGKHVTVSLSLSTLRDGGGDIVGVCGIMRDVSQRNDALLRLQESEQRFRSITETTGDAIISADHRGRITSWNPGAATIFGYEEKEILGKNVAVLCAPELREAHNRGFAQSLETGTGSVERGTVELIGLNAAGVEFPIEASFGSWPTETGPAFGAVIRDRTEQAQVAEQFQDAAEAAENANVAKSRFLANMSHEIRTPMNGVVGMTDVLLDSGLSGEQVDFVQTIRVSALSLRGIIDDLLDFSKIEAGELRLESVPFELREPVDGVAALFRQNAADKGVELRAEIGAGLPRNVMGDSHRLRQILGNLVGNAVKFTPCGEIVVRALLRADGSGSQCVRFEVADTGLGLGEEARSRIFKPFVQADGSTTRKYGGTGLGLTICRQLAEMMGGEIGVESVEGEGSVFWFTVLLEAAPNQQSLASVADEDTGGAAESAVMQRTILVADDNPINRKVVRAMLNQLNYASVLVEDGAAAVEAVKADHYDLILMDCQMPVMGGFEATAAIRALGGKGEVPIIAMTAQALPEDRQACLDAGMDDYVAKPVSKADLKATVRKQLGLSMRGAGREGAPTEPRARAAAKQEHEVVDLAVLATLREQTFDGESDLVPELIGNFLSDVPNECRALLDAIEEHNLDGAARQAHRLRSSTAGLGATTLTSICETIEYRGDAGDLEAVQTAARGLLEELAAVESAFERYLRFRADKAA